MQQAYMPGVPPGAPLPSRLCQAAMVSGIVSMVLVPTVYGMVISILLGPVAFVLGVRARGRVRRGQETGRGFALTGIVLGAVSFVVSAVVIVLFLLAVTVQDEEPAPPRERPGGSRIEAAESYS